MKANNESQQLILKWFNENEENERMRKKLNRLKKRIASSDRERKKTLLLASNEIMIINQWRKPKKTIRNVLTIVGYY